MVISKKNILRLCRYREVLERFKGYGSERILSSDISSAIGTTAVQVRKDFSILGFTGKKKSGYHIETLLGNIHAFMKNKEPQTAVIFGTCTLGMHLVEQQLLLSQAVRICAIVDNGQENACRDATRCYGDIPVIKEDRLLSIVTDEHVRFAIIATPEDKAQHALDTLVMVGIEGVLNLTGVDLKCPKTCMVVSVNIRREFEDLIFRITHRSDSAAKEVIA
jgi:NADH/NAD ratio-sensing transcriptional regulator Rex